MLLLLLVLLLVLLLAEQIVRVTKRVLALTQGSPRTSCFPGRVRKRARVALAQGLRQACYSPGAEPAPR